MVVVLSRAGAPDRHPPKYEPPQTAAPAAYKEQPAGAELMQPAQPSDARAASGLVGRCSAMRG